MSEQKPENPAAFPNWERYKTASCPKCFHPFGISPDPGMTLRDWFAGQALAALIAKIPLHDENGEHGIPSSDERNRQIRADVAESAYAYAHYMLRERGKSNG